MKTVGEVMARSLLTLTEDATLAAAATEMASRSVG